MTGTVGQALADLRQRFAKAGLDDPAQEARILLGGLLGLDRTGLLSQADRRLDPADMDRIQAAAQARDGGMPVHRILGKRGFHAVELMLSAGTLEPRPDTETLVDAVLPFLRARVASGGSARLLDLGTGTGAIALALLALVPSATALGVDISADAVATANRNAVLNQLADRFEARTSDWFANVEGRFDLIVSNPPYIATAEIKTLSREVIEHDPLAALDGGPDGLDAYRILARDARNHLLPGGLIGLEIGHDQKGSVTALFEAEGHVRNAALADLGGRDRVLIFARS